jgi:hypothetical protein
VFLLELAAALALASAAYEVNAVKANLKQIPAAIASALHLIFMIVMSNAGRFSGRESLAIAKKGARRISQPIIRSLGRLFTLRGWSAEV